MKIGLIGDYLDGRTADDYPERIRKVSGGELNVAAACGLRDAPGGRTGRQWCLSKGVRYVETIADVVAECDGLIVLSPDRSEAHEALCRAPLQSGKPTYMESPFAPDREIAERLCAEAEKNATPCWSASPLRFAREFEGFPAVATAAFWGSGKLAADGAHQLEPLLMLMRQAPERVMALREDGCERLVIGFEGGHYATVACFFGGGPFQANVCGPCGNRLLTVKSDYRNAFFHQLVRFFRTRDVPAPREDALRTAAVLGACMKALKRPGEWIGI
jgi:hypothetical protein